MSADIMLMMAQGAMMMAAAWGMTYGKKHASAGWSESDWRLLTQNAPWSPRERREARRVIAQAVNSTLEEAGLPSEPLPGQYVAAVIAIFVSPINWLVAASRMPETYDADRASGMITESEIVPMSREQAISLVMAYAKPPYRDLPRRWPQELEDQVHKDTTDA